MESTVPSQATLEAQVNAPPPPVTLYNEEGRAMTVAAADVDYWLAHGFARESFDAKALAKELRTVLKSAMDAVDDYVKDALDAEAIDTHHEAAKATAERAMRDAGDLFIRLHQGLQLQYPVKQPREGDGDAG